MNITIINTQASAIIFSASLNVRNALRYLVSECGYNAVCFENEAICYDNLCPIQPKLVVIDTDVVDVVWRFVFAIHANDTGSPLIVVSDQLRADSIETNDTTVQLHVTSRDIQSHQFKKLIKEIGGKKERTKISSDDKIPMLVGQTQSMKTIRSILPNIAKAYDPVLIYGEKGTGKELLARTIVGLSKGDIDFIKIDCNELTYDMLINGGLEHFLELGTKGKSRIYLLDHIDKLSLNCQAGILLFLESAQKGDSDPERPHIGKVRFLATSESKIDALKQRSDFRKDLFYSLNVIPIEMPPLRERKGDISLLMDYLIISACIKNQKCIIIPSKRAREACFTHDWPGNIDELQRQVERIVDKGDETILQAHAQIVQNQMSQKEQLISRLAFEELPKFHEIRNYLPVISKMSLKDICDEFVVKTERQLLKKALEATSWNRKKAAELLNISYKSMLNKIKVYDII